MENPVVVFVLGDRCGDKSLTFPTGWTAEGQRLNGAEEISDKNCCVILLADDEEIPPCKHANKDREQPLPVVVHTNSEKYKSTTIADTVLATWGTPISRESDIYSHIKGNGVFDEILELLRNPSCAEAFAKKRRTANDLDVLDKLAAICQICMIDPHTKTNVNLWWRIFNRLQDGAFKDELREAQENSWQEALKTIAVRANELPSKPLNQKNGNQRQDPSLEKTPHDS